MNILTRNVVLYSGGNVCDICGFCELKSTDKGCAIRLRHMLGGGKYVLTVKPKDLPVSTFNVAGIHTDLIMGEKVDLDKQIFISLIKDEGSTISTVATGFLNAGEIGKKQITEEVTLEEKTEKNIEENTTKVFKSETKVPEPELKIPQPAPKLEEQIVEEINDTIKNFCFKDIDKESPCVNCKYREHFFTDAVVLANNEPAPSPKVLVGEFYAAVKPQLDELFSKNQAYEVLSEAIAHSKWVKVNNANEDGHYAIGLINDESGIKYITYAVPATYSQEPPKEFSGYCQWLPINKDNPKGDGFWIMYQCAKSGESVKM